MYKQAAIWIGVGAFVIFWLAGVLEAAIIDMPQGIAVVGKEVCRVPLGQFVGWIGFSKLFVFVANFD